MVTARVVPLFPPIPTIINLAESVSQWNHWNESPLLPGLGSFSLSLEFVQRSGRLDYILSILDNDVGVAVRKFRRELVTERHVLRVDYNMVTPSSGRVNS
jgi:hypothetical protein